MRHLGRIALVLAVVAVMAAPANAQPGRGFGGGQLFLLTQESVQKELKVSEDQIKQVKEADTKRQEAMRGLQGLSRDEVRTKMEQITKTGDEAVAKILKDDQKKRLKQIALQQQGTRAFSDAEVAKALNITEDQKGKLTTIQEETGRAMRDLFGPNVNREEAQKKMAELRKSSMEKAVAVLTAAQKKSWEELAGAPFTGEIRAPMIRPQPTPVQP